MAGKSRASFGKAKQKERGVLGFLREIMRQYENGELTWEQLKLITEHKNPFDPALVGGKPEKIWHKSKLRLEDKYFRVDSFNWPLLPTTVLTRGVNYKASNDSEIREIVAIDTERIMNEKSLAVPSSEYKAKFYGVQLFSREAAVRETRRANKSLPTISDWLRLLSDYFGRRIKIPKSTLKRLLESDREYSLEIVGGIRPDEMRKLEEHFKLPFISYHYKTVTASIGDYAVYHCHEDKVHIYFSVSQCRICICKDPADRMMAVRCLEA